MAKAKTSSTGSPKRIRPAITPEARESQLISLAIDLVEQRLLDGTASSQETTHFLKLGSSKAVLEREKLIEENKLLRAKTEALEDDKKSSSDYQAVLRALRSYKGEDDPDEYEDY